MDIYICLVDIWSINFLLAYVWLSVCLSVCVSPFHLSVSVNHLRLFVHAYCLCLSIYANNRYKIIFRSLQYYEKMEADCRVIDWFVWFISFKLYFNSIHSLHYIPLLYSIPFHSSSSLFFHIFLFHPPSLVLFPSFPFSSFIPLYSFSFLSPSVLSILFIFFSMIFLVIVFIYPIHSFYSLLHDSYILLHIQKKTMIMQYLYFQKVFHYFFSSFCFIYIGSHLISFCVESYCIPP